MKKGSRKEGTKGLAVVTVRKADKGTGRGKTGGRDVDRPPQTGEGGGRGLAGWLVRDSPTKTEKFILELLVSKANAANLLFGEIIFWKVFGRADRGGKETAFDRSGGETRGEVSSWPSSVEQGRR